MLRKLGYCFVLVGILIAYEDAHGQFYTIQPKKKTIQVERVCDPVMPHNDNAADVSNKENNELPMQGREASIDSVSNSRERLLQAYLSMSLPIKGDLIVTSPYGQRIDPFGSGKKKMHSGLDLRCADVQVFAMLPGQVRKIGSDKKSGIWIEIKHGDITVSYCHLSNVLVKKNEWVSAGQTVAISGNTGRSTGPHLHITAKMRGKRINPEILLDYIKNTKAMMVAQIATLQDSD